MLPNSVEAFNRPSVLSLLGNRLVVFGVFLLDGFVNLLNHLLILSQSHCSSMVM